MRQYQKASLILLSSFSLLFGCTCTNHGNFVKQENRAYTVDNLSRVFIKENKALFKAKIDMSDQHLSGILYIKLFDQNDYRFVLITEVGITIFDFEFKGNEFKVHKILEAMNKSYIINTLKNDIQTAFIYSIAGKKQEVYTEDSDKYVIYKVDAADDFNYYFFDKETKLLSKIENSSACFKNFEVDYSNYSNNIINEMKITHYNYSLNINFIRIEDMQDHE